VARAAALLVVLAVLVTGCSRATDYEDAETVAAALEAEGLGCEERSRPAIEAGGRGSPASSGSCSVQGEGVQIFVFETEEDLDLWFERGRMETVPTARGGNWVVVTLTQETAARVADALGGDS
jgi:hypothetical protein